MYDRTQDGIPKREARRLAYEHIRSQEEFAGQAWAVRTILGATRQHFHDLRTYAANHGKSQSGSDNRQAWSQTKHALNAIVCNAYSAVTQKIRLAIFEPTQGAGDATRLYVTYGFVVAVEIKPATFAAALDAHRERYINLNDYIGEGWTLDELRASANGKVLMPTQSQDAYSTIPKLLGAKWCFDVIDVDPFQDSRRLVDAVLPLLNDVSLLFVSLNDMTTRHARSKRSADLFGEADTPEFRETMWMYDCWRFMWTAVEHHIALIPIVIHKCWTASERLGIDRIYFLAVRHPRAGLLVQEYLDRKTLRKDKTSSIGDYRDDTIPIVTFGRDVSPDDPANILNSHLIGRLLTKVHARLRQS